MKGQEMKLSDSEIDLDPHLAKEISRIYLSSFREDFIKYKFDLPEGGENSVFDLVSSI